MEYYYIHKVYGEKDLKFAVIDIGSNTAKAEIYKYKHGSLQLIKKYVERDMIADHKDTGALDSEGTDILINIMNGFLGVCKKNGADKIFPYATQSLRGIDNADTVTEKIKILTGLDIKIISGEEEARLCFESFQAEGGAENGVLSDMGGGSTELSFIKSGELIKSVSLPFGSRSVTHGYKIDILPDNEQEEKISALIDGYIKNKALPADNGQMFACGGSSSGLFRLYNNGKSVNINDLISFYDGCKKDVKKTETLARELTPERYDTVFAGIYAYICLCRALGCVKINHCKSTCRKGYAAKLVRDGYVK